MLDDGAFDRAPGREHVGDVGGGRARHDRDAPVAQRDDAFVRERAQRLAHDRARHAEVRAERDLRQLGAGREAALEDRGAHRVADARLGAPGLAVACPCASSSRPA